MAASPGRYDCSASQLASVAAIMDGEVALAKSICAEVNVGALGAQSAVIQWLVRQQKGQLAAQQALAHGQDTGYLLISAMLVS
jgi:hypothetical protein